jgi:hypothetical protein
LMIEVQQRGYLEINRERKRIQLLRSFQSCIAALKRLGSPGTSGTHAIRARQRHVGSV